MSSKNILEIDLHVAVSVSYYNKSSLIFYNNERKIFSNIIKLIALSWVIESSRVFDSTLDKSNSKSKIRKFESNLKVEFNYLNWILNLKSRFDSNIRQKMIKKEN